MNDEVTLRLLFSRLKSPISKLLHIGLTCALQDSIYAVWQQLGVEGSEKQDLE